MNEPFLIIRAATRVGQQVLTDVHKARQRESDGGETVTRAELVTIIARGTETLGDALVEVLGIDDADDDQADD